MLRHARCMQPQHCISGVPRLEGAGVSDHVWHLLCCHAGLAISPGLSEKGIELRPSVPPQWLPVDLRSVVVLGEVSN